MTLNPFAILLAEAGDPEAGGGTGGDAAAAGEAQETLMDATGLSEGSEEVAAEPPAEPPLLSEDYYNHRIMVPTREGDKPTPIGEVGQLLREARQELASARNQSAFYQDQVSQLTGAAASPPPTPEQPLTPEERAKLEEFLIDPITGQKNPLVEEVLNQKKFISEYVQRQESERQARQTEELRGQIFGEINTRIQSHPVLKEISSTKALDMEVGSEIGRMLNDNSIPIETRKYWDSSYGFPELLDRAIQNVAGGYESLFQAKESAKHQTMQQAVDKGMGAKVPGGGGHAPTVEQDKTFDHSDKGRRSSIRQSLQREMERKRSEGMGGS
jgi:hypothetical protein